MKKFEKILRKHIEAAKDQTNLGVAPEGGGTIKIQNPCYIGSTSILDVDAVCEAVGILSRNVGNPMGNDCAKKIKTSNTQPCSKGNYTKAEVVILKCNNYARSVVDALPQNATQQQEDEAARKAKCDCLNLAVFGRPASISSSVGFEAGIMKKEVVDFFESGCSYAWISNVCSELRKVRDAILAISPVCKLPI